MAFKPGKLLRIYVGELDMHAGQPLYQWLIEEARRHELAGATALRGLEGFGAHSEIHTTKVLRLSVDLPVVIEIIDSAERIDAFLPRIDDAIEEGLVTLERVDMCLYRKNRH
jgi:PII-like signaling protein